MSYPLLVYVSMCLHIVSYTCADTSVLLLFCTCGEWIASVHLCALLSASMAEAAALVLDLAGQAVLKEARAFDTEF